MPAVSSFFLVIALVLAVVIGPQTRPWTWGPAMLALGLAALAGLPSIWRRGKAPADLGLLALGLLTAGWFAWRASISPVAELGHADLLLIVSVVASFISIRAISGHNGAEKILIWGVALLLLANVVVIGMQMRHPGYSPVFRPNEASGLISGFFAHYNEAANYLIASSMLVAAAALTGKAPRAVRGLWLLIAIAGLAGVWFTRSRGGIFGAAIASGMLVCGLLIVGKRRGAKWFAPVLIAIPLGVIAILAFLFIGWQHAQEIRSAGTANSIAGMLDNNGRLYFLGIALSCIGLHPMAGGGSRSFSWECFRFVDGKANGDIITHKPEFVHSELIQSATDYGLVGAGLLVGLLVALAMGAFLRLVFEEKPGQPDSRDTWRVGALAALAGMFVQSCFSFVFHLMPGIILLGICLGQLSRTIPGSTGARAHAGRILLSLAALGCVALLFPTGWKGARVTRVLWPTHFSKVPEITAESKTDALTEAIRIWPHSSFYQERATVQQVTAGASGTPGFREPAEQALDDYLEASLLHPFDPELAVNRANVLSQLERDAEAEEWFAKAIQLQGGMEPGFRGHFSQATHLLRKGLRAFDPANPEKGHDALELSAEQIEIAVRKMHWITPDLREPRVAIHESLGTAREAMGDREGAMESYNFAATLPGGSRAHYRAAVLTGKMAVEAWSKRRPSEALMHFMEARKRVGQAGKELPEGVKPSQQAEYTAYLDQTIEFLKGAKVEPGIQR